jgi:hypothetical protein
MLKDLACTSPILGQGYVRFVLDPSLAQDDPIIWRRAASLVQHQAEVAQYAGPQNDYPCKVLTRRKARRVRPLGYNSPSQ